jgi:hypothetical protein
MPSSSPEITLDMKARKYAEWLTKKPSTSAPTWTHCIDYLKSHGIDSEIARKYSLGYVSRAPRGEERFQGTLAIPYITRAGVVAIKYRCVQEGCSHKVHGGKYMQHAGQPSRLYNARAFFDASDTIGMAEGEIDAIAATEHVGLPTLGMPGAEQWIRHSTIWQIALKDYDMVVFFADGDEAGVKSGRTVTEDLGPKHGRLVRCDEGEDVASSVMKGRVDDLRERAGL